MKRHNINTSGISKMFDLIKSGRTRKIARLWYVKKMDIEQIAEAMGYGTSVIVSEIMLINKLIENNISCKICSQCGEEFYSGERGTQICDECREKNRKERYETQKSQYKSDKKQNTKPKNKHKFIPLSQVEKERAIYNKEHNTLLSYGQFVALMGY